MKPSHLRTPRTLEEGTFTPGYRCAAQRDVFTELGHWILNAFCAVGLVIVVALLAMGVL